MPMPKPDEESKEFFETILPDDPRVKVRPMFGNVAGFVNGNMFIGLFGSDLFVRLPEGSRAELLREGGAALLEPIKGRPLKEYVVVPKAWRQDHSKVRNWVNRSLTWVGDMPEKPSK